MKAFRGDEFLDKMMRIGRCLETLEQITQDTREEPQCCGNCEHWMPNLYVVYERRNHGCCALDYDGFVEARIVPPEWHKSFWCEAWKRRGHEMNGRHFWGIRPDQARDLFVLQQCPACGYYRVRMLIDWLCIPMERQLRSYCEKTGQDVFYRNLGWKKLGEVVNILQGKEEA